MNLYVTGMNVNQTARGLLYLFVGNIHDSVFAACDGIERSCIYKWLEIRRWLSSEEVEPGLFWIVATSRKTPRDEHEKGMFKTRWKWWIGGGEGFVYVEKRKRGSTHPLQCCN